MRKKTPLPKRAPRKTAGRYAIDPSSSPRVAESAPDFNHGVRVISATEAARNLSDVINRVSYKGESFVIERGGQPVCQLTPVASNRFTGADFLQLLTTLPKPAAEFLDALEALAREQATIEPSAWER